jgi:hypothetical protein
MPSPRDIEDMNTLRSVDNANESLSGPMLDV